MVYEREEIFKDRVETGIVHALAVPDPGWREVSLDSSAIPRDAK
jgi:hypothetical protein